MRGGGIREYVVEGLVGVKGLGSVVDGSGEGRGLA